jgi:hypothetical protein
VIDRGAAREGRCVSLSHAISGDARSAFPIKAMAAAVRIAAGVGTLFSMIERR